MEQQLKKIGSYPLEALQMAIQNLSSDQQKAFKEYLDVVEDELPSDRSRPVKHSIKKTTSKKEKFEDLMKKMEAELWQFDEHQRKSERLRITIPINNNFKTMNIDELSSCHKEIMDKQHDLKFIDNIYHYMR